MDTNSLSHTKWNCKYHIVFAPKFRRKVIYGQLKRDIANILSTLCKRKGVKIVEAEMCSDHVHMLVEIPPSISVSSFVGQEMPMNHIPKDFFSYLPPPPSGTPPPGRRRIEIVLFSILFITVPI